MPRSRPRTPPKKRHLALHATTAGVVSHLTIVADPATGAIELVQADPDSYRSVVYHERDSGKDKVLLDGRAAPHINAFNAHAQFMGTFRYAIGVDTNFRPEDGFAIACVFAVLGPLNPEAEKARIELLDAYVIVEPLASIDPERIGWHLAIRENILPSQRKPKGRIALVTDSALDALPAINARKADYYAGHSLPADVSLVYASVDKPTQTLPSALIRACDRYATSVAETVRQRGHDVLRPGDENFRGWYPFPRDLIRPC